MAKETNVEKIREISIKLLYAVEIKEHPNGMIVQHPYTNTRYTMNPENGQTVDLTNKKERQEWQTAIESQIRKSEVDTIIYLLLNEPWSIVWLNLVEPYLSLKDFSDILSNVWTVVEFPNNCGVKLTTLIKYFKQADKKILMDSEEYQTWVNLPDEVTLYRGIAGDGKVNGISWTRSEQTAEWFAKRLLCGEQKGEVYKIIVPKEHCLCYFNGRDEQEVILDTSLREVQDKISLYQICAKDA